MQHSLYQEPASGVLHCIKALMYRPRGWHAIHALMSNPNKHFRLHYCWQLAAMEEYRRH